MDHVARQCFKIELIMLHFLSAENLENKMDNLSLGASVKPTESIAAAQQPQGTESGSGDASAEAAEGSN